MAKQVDLDVVKPFTKSSLERLGSMVEALHTIDKEKIPGDIVECGVWKGGNIMLARMMCPERVCWLYDTFDGMTEPHPEHDVKRDGERAIDRYNLKKAGGTKWDAVSLSEVRDNFIGVGLSLDKIHFVAGSVEDSLRILMPIRIAVLRLDLDWYGPTKIALHRLYGRVSHKGFLIIDDYGHWLGCKKAVDEYFGDYPPRIRKEVDYSCRMYRKC